MHGSGTFIARPDKHPSQAVAGDGHDARLDTLLLENARLQARLEKMTALGELALGVTHDFNNILQTVLSGARMIERRADDPAAVARLAHMVEQAARRGAAVTRRLLTGARRDELVAEPIDIPPMLDGLCEVLPHMIGSAITIRVDLAADLPKLLADRPQLETVLTNLATNARDAMPGGGTLTFSAGIPATTDDFLLISAGDTGIGMDASTLARVTDPFFTTKPIGLGTGLGLALARSFVEAAGGTLAIASEPGTGTIVTLRLPTA